MFFHIILEVFYLLKDISPTPQILYYKYYTKIAWSFHRRLFSVYLRSFLEKMAFRRCVIPWQKGKQVKVNELHFGPCDPVVVKNGRCSRSVALSFP